MTTGRPRIAVFAGPDATVLNSAPLITSNKARQRAGLPPRAAPAGQPLAFDPLRPQRLAAPVTVFIEAFSAHPMESDAAELYAPPDGYLDANGAFHVERTSPADRAVHQVELRPEDGLYPLPYMARQADGRPWEGDEADPFGPPGRYRQPFYPDASRVFEEIDRLQPTEDGLGGALARLADFDHIRAAPPAGYTKAGEQRGRDWFAYRPPHLIRQPSRLVLARLTNVVARALATGSYDGALWLEGSPYVEETTWWLNLLLDTGVPLAACASQRPHGEVGNDGDRNIIDAVSYLVSRAWAGADGRNQLGAVVVMDQQILASRAVQKGDARPGGYVATGGHGGVLGTITSVGRTAVSMRPVWRHTWQSDVRLTQLPRDVAGLSGSTVPVRDAAGDLIPEAIPQVRLVKHGQYIEPTDEVDATTESGILAMLAQALAAGGLAGFVAEGSAPFGTLNESAEAALRHATFSGLPVVKVGRGNADGVTESTYVPFGIAGSNLTATKARLLLMAALLKFGALPAAVDPAAPTPDEVRATQQALAAFREVFETH